MPGQRVQCRVVEQASGRRRLYVLSAAVLQKRSASYQTPDSRRVGWLCGRRLQWGSGVDALLLCIPSNVAPRSTPHTTHGATPHSTVKQTLASVFGLSAAPVPMTCHWKGRLLRRLVHLVRLGVEAVSTSLLFFLRRGTVASLPSEWRAHLTANSQQPSGRASACPVLVGADRLADWTSGTESLVLQHRPTFVWLDVPGLADYSVR